MALIRPKNIPTANLTEGTSFLTSVPAVDIDALPAGTVINTQYIDNGDGSAVKPNATAWTNIKDYTFSVLRSGSIIRMTHRYRSYWGSNTNGSGDWQSRYLINSTTIFNNTRLFGNVADDKKYTHMNRQETFDWTSTGAGSFTMSFQVIQPGNIGSQYMDWFHANGGEGNMGVYILEIKQ